MNMCFNLLHDADDGVAVDIVDAVVDIVVVVAGDVAAAAVVVDYWVLNLNHAKPELLAKDVVAKYWVARVIEHWLNDVVMNQQLDKLTVR